MRLIKKRILELENKEGLGLDEAYFLKFFYGLNQITPNDIGKYLCIISKGMTLEEFNRRKWEPRAKHARSRYE